MTKVLAHETYWQDKYVLEDAEAAHYMRLAGNAPPQDTSGSSDSGLNRKVQSLEAENSELKQTVHDLVSRLSKLELRVNSLEGSGGDRPVAGKAAQNGKAKPAAVEDDDDDVDLFGSDEDDDAAVKLREDRLKQYAAKKEKKPGPIAKSSVILDVKPWDDETDMVALEKQVRTIVMDGLLWGVSKLVPVAFNIKKLQIVCVVEDEKVSIEELQEKLEEFEDYIQSVDIAAFNKI